MKILKLHHPKGHPYWDKDEYNIELPDGKFIYPAKSLSDNFGGFRVYWNNKGVWVQKCASGSGYGKIDIKDEPPILLVDIKDYDKIEFVGHPLVMSDELKNDLQTNEISF